MELTSTT